MSTTPGYYRTSSPLAFFLPGVTSTGKIRYRAAERTLSPENVAHREQQAIRRQSVAGRVARSDRGALRVAARQAVSA